MSYLSDKEKRLLFSALTREKKVCEEVDKGCCREPYELSLKRIVEGLERKFYYDRFEKEIRDKAIDEFADKIKRFVDCGHLCSPTELRWTDLSVCKMIDEITKQVKKR